MEFSDLQPFIQTIVLGAVISLAMLGGLSGRLLKRLAAVEVSVSENLVWRPFVANWLTAYSVLMLIGVVMVACGYPVFGIQFALFWGLFDRLDGRSAHACGVTLSAPTKWHLDEHGVLWMQVHKHDGTVLYDACLKRPSPFRRWWFEMNFAGGTHLGAVLDAGFDKVKIFPTLAFFVFLGLIPLKPVCLLALPEIAGTVTRRPFDTLWPFSLLARHMQGSRATWAGKWKTIVLWLVIIACIPVSQDWINDEGISAWTPFTISFLLWLGILLAFTSVATRLKIMRKNATITQALDAIGEGGLEHDND